MQSYLIRVQIGDKIGQLYCVLNMSVLALDFGNLEQGKNLSTEAINMARELGIKNIEGRAIKNLASVAQREGDKKQFDELMSQVRKIETETGLSFLD